MRSPTPLLGSLRAALKPLAVGLCVAQGAPLLHLAFARHELCPHGDGEWVDSEAAPTDPPASSTNPTAAGFGREAMPGALAAAHEHCAVIGLLRAARLHTKATAVSSVPFARSTAAAVPTLPSPVLSALEVAPKQSPPPLAEG